MMGVTKKISYEEWVEKFKPIKNHLIVSSPFDDCMFETYGNEVEFVKAQKDNLIWTIVESDGTWLLPGYHFVDRLGYLIASVPYVPDEESFDVEIESCDEEEPEDDNYIGRKGSLDRTLNLADEAYERDRDEQV